MTTGGLRDFVADTAEGEDFSLAAVRSELSTEFTVRQEPGAAGSGMHRRTWLDTFDWRLYKAGLTLQFEQARRGGLLVLSKADGTPQAEQPVTRWPRRPGLAEDLPPGPVRDRILVLTSPRALLPIVKAVSTVSVNRLLNADGKTVARLVAGARHRHRAHAELQRAAPPPSSRRGWPWPRSAAIPARRARRRACWPACPASRTPARACSSRR